MHKNIDKTTLDYSYLTGVTHKVQSVKQRPCSIPSSAKEALIATYTGKFSSIIDRINGMLYTV